MAIGEDWSHGRRKGVRGARPPDLKIFSKKKIVFLVSSGRIQISSLLAAPLQTFLVKIH